MVLEDLFNLMSLEHKIRIFDSSYELIYYGSVAKTPEILLDEFIEWIEVHDFALEIYIL